MIHDLSIPYPQEEHLHHDGGGAEAAVLHQAGAARDTPARGRGEARRGRGGGVPPWECCRPAKSDGTLTWADVGPVCDMRHL